MEDGAKAKNKYKMLLVILLVFAIMGLAQQNSVKVENVVSFTEKKTEAVKLNMKQAVVMNQVLEIYALKNASNSLCRNHSLIFAKGLRNFEPWALKMMDSSSKMPSGVLIGNLFDFGSYSQCISISMDEISGKLCTLKLHPDIFLLKKVLSYRNISEKRWDKVKIFVENATFDWSVCVPNSCDVIDVLSHFRKLIGSLTDGLNVTVSLHDKNCLTQSDDSGFTNMELIVIFTLSAYVGAICAITIIDIYIVKDEDNHWLKIFSASRNTKKVFAKSSSDLDCVHGLRFISTCYVIIGHRYLMLMFYPVINSLQIMDWILYYRSTAITGGTLCVDTFFMISGMLVSFGVFQENSKRKINWIMFYFSRFMRITPPLALVVLWYCTVMHKLGSGPLWNDMLETIQKPCQEYWWATILHIQNYVHPFPLCLTQTWYLTCDMQYFFLSPIILIPFMTNRMWGSINWLFCYFTSVLINFQLAYVSKYNGGVPVTNQLFATKYFQYHYIAPHTRASTYIIGLGFGLIVHKYKDHKIRISLPIAVLGWLICIATMLASLMGCHVFFLEDHDYKRIESSTFLAISRSTWTIGIVWIIWACINGYGGPINYVLSLHIFRVFGKISYGMYLLHMGVQYMMSGASKMPGYFSDFSAVYAGLADLFMMLIAGFIFTILFEAPLVQSLNLFVKKGNKTQVKPTEIKIKGPIN